MRRSLSTDMERAWARREEFIPEQIELDDVWAETDSEEHIYRGEE